MEAAVLTSDWHNCERGNIWLVQTEEGFHQAYLRFHDSDFPHACGDDVTSDLWLEISIRPCNYPGLNVAVIRVTDHELAEHLKKEFGNGGWSVRKLNLEGISVDDIEHGLKDK